MLLDGYTEPIWKPNAKESEWVFAKTQGWPRELIFVEYMAHEQVSWVYTAFAGTAACWTVVLHWYGNEMPRAVNRYKLRLGGWFLSVSDWYDKYRLWIMFCFLSCCSTVLFQALLHSNCIFSSEYFYWERSIRGSVNQPVTVTQRDAEQLQQLFWTAKKITYHTLYTSFFLVT